MKELGLFEGKNNNKYIGYYNDIEKEVEIMGPLGDQGKGTLINTYVEKAESEAKAVETIIRTIENF